MINWILAAAFIGAEPLWNLVDEYFTGEKSLQEFAAQAQQWTQLAQERATATLAAREESSRLSERQRAEGAEGIMMSGLRSGLGMSDPQVYGASLGGASGLMAGTPPAPSVGAVERAAQISGASPDVIRQMPSAVQSVDPIAVALGIA